MKNKINIAEILKDCPIGMELYSPMYGVGKLTKITNKIHVKFPKEHNVKCFRLDGKVSEEGEVMLFPKDKTNWEEFVPPYNFKDGDVCYVKTRTLFEYIFIFKVSEDYNYIKRYVNLSAKHLLTDKSALCTTDDIMEIRLATKEEKEKLFQAIKDNGYHWNAETKTLEKLVESKEDIDDKVVMSGIYFDREYYADEVELHLNNYVIEIRNGKAYAVFKN